MPQTLFLQATTATIAATNYKGAGMSGLNAGTTVEAETNHKIYEPGVFSKLTVHVDAGGTGRSVRFRKNAVNGNQIVSPADSSEVTSTDSSNTDTVASGDAISLQFNLATGTPLFYSVTGVFTANNGHVAHYQTGGVTTGAATWGYEGITAGFGVTSAGADSGYVATVASLMRVPGIWKNLSATTVGASTTDGTHTVTARKDAGVDLALTISIAAGATGRFEDTTNTVTIAAGDNIFWVFRNNSVAGQVQVTAFCTISCSQPANDIVYAAASTYDTASTKYPPLTGRQGYPATESFSQIKHNFRGTLTKLRTRSDSNNTTSTVTMRVRKNGANGNNTLTIGAAATGDFEDTTSVDTFTETDLVNYQVSGGTSSNMAVNWIAATETPAIGMRRANPLDGLVAPQFINPLS